MIITLENSTSRRQNEGNSALYLSEAAHKNVEKTIETLKSFGKQISGCEKMTKKAMFEKGAEVLLEIVEKMVKDELAKEKEAKEEVAVEN